MAGLLTKLLGAQQGQMAGNAFDPLKGSSTSAVDSYLNRGAQAGSQEVMQDPRYSQYFGSDMDTLRGQIGTASSEERDLATRGYGLKPEDHEAYGQAAGNISRQAGQRDAMLSQALAARGLSASGGARSAVASSTGNKLESLARVQTDIAQKRMQSNMDRLGQTRNFMNQLMGQQSGRMDQYGQAIGAKDMLSQSKAGMGMGALAQQQAQQNEQFEQKLATGNSGIMGALRRGVLSGAEGQINTLMNPASAMSGSGGGGGGGSGGGAAGGAKMGAGGAGAGPAGGAGVNPMMLMAMSDERLKKNVKSGDKKVTKLLDAISAKEYEYKDDAEGPGVDSGRRISPMAQDLEKSELGKAMVEEKPQGKAVNYGKGLGTILAAQASLHQRIKKLEGK